MQDVDEEILTTAPHMGHAILDKCPTISPYMPQVGGVRLAIDRCIMRVCFVSAKYLYHLYSVRIQGVS